MSTAHTEIKCPQCHWQPDGKGHWSCSCDHVWNTFETAGECPSCDLQWEDTQCPKCNSWSKHEDWYIITIDFGELFSVKTVHNKYL